MNPECYNKLWLIVKSSFLVMTDAGFSIWVPFSFSLSTCMNVSHHLNSELCFHVPNQVLSRYLLTFQDGPPSRLLPDFSWVSLCCLGPLKLFVISKNFNSLPHFFFSWLPLLTANFFLFVTFFSYCSIPFV